MLNLKKTAVAVLALGSSAVFAGSMGPVCSAVNVTVPCESTAWDFGGKALYLSTSVGHNSVGAERTFTGTNGNSVSVGQNPQYGWGFMVEGSYHFNTGNDVNLNWYHIANGHDRDFTGSTTINSDPFLVPAPHIVDGGSATFTGLDADVSPHWDAVNLEFGQHVDFGENKSIRFHGGFEYARLTANNTFAAVGTVTNPNVTPLTPTAFNYSVSTNPSYNGFGPRVGADMAYDWGNGLGLYANGAATLLAGSNKYSTTTTDYTTLQTVTVNGSATTVVPELEGKLGATYTYAMAQGDLTLDAGWMWVNYFNAISSHGSDINSAATTANFGLQGPFIGLNWLGNIA